MEYESEHFQVRKLKEDDATSLFTEYCGSTPSAKYISTAPHLSVEATVSKIKQWCSAYDDVDARVQVYGVADIVNDDVFGLMVFVFNQDYAEIHFGISDKMSHQGLATQLCLAGLEYLRRQGVQEVRTHPYAGHHASIRVLEKSGFINHGTLLHHAPFPNLGSGLFDCADMRIDLSNLAMEGM
jgi:ribosomal-protein-alanine N-acetyltransferase